MRVKEAYVKVQPDWFAMPPPEEVPEIAVFEFLDEVAAKYPDKTALIFF